MQGRYSATAPFPFLFIAARGSQGTMVALRETSIILATAVRFFVVDGTEFVRECAIVGAK